MLQYLRKALTFVHALDDSISLVVGHLVMGP